jgi:hypothetical protein
MLGPYTTPNPWVFGANDPQGNSLSISVPWNSSTRALQNATVVRASGCTLFTVYIGLGADGQPETSANVYSVPVGTGTVTARTLSHHGLSTIDDLLALQVTAN